MYNFTNKRRNIPMFNKIIVLFAILAAAACMLAACDGIEGLNSFFNSLKGELIGNDYTITEWDNFGNLNFTVHGDKITMNAQTDSDGELVNSYIDITIDGYEWNHVGSTLVFMQGGVDMITDFQVPENMEANYSQSTGLMALDRTINSYRNFFGKELVVLVSTQNGTPIGLFQGDSCYVEIPENLPKTTKISIDGKLVYVHKADIDIIPAALFGK